MRTLVQFRSDAFPAYPGEDELINPERWGKRLAEFLAAKLPEHGVKVGPIYAEDWGWGIPIENEAFPMFVGCGNVTWEGNMFACSIWPSKREVRKGLFRKVSTIKDLE